MKELEEEVDVTDVMFTVPRLGTVACSEATKAVFPFAMNEATDRPWICVLADSTTTGRGAAEVGGEVTPDGIEVRMGVGVGVGSREGLGVGWCVGCEWGLRDG